MKKNLLKTFAILFIGTTAIAQQTLTSAGINPIVGDNFSLKMCAPVNPGNSGANQTWNFSSMTQTATINNTIVTVASTPNGSLFPNATVSNYDGNSYTYYNTTSTLFNNAGNSNSITTLVYQNQETLLQFPFNYTNSNTDTWSTIFTSNSITFTRTGSTNINYDGYGSLVTPAGSFNNSARVRMVQTYSDVSTFITITYTNTQFFWYTNGNHVPLAATYTLVTSLGAGSGSGAYYLNNPIIVSINELTKDNEVSFQVYPNPANESINIVSNNTLSKIEVIDVTGKLIVTRNLQLENNLEKTVNLNVDDFVNGLYLIRITSSNGATETKKITITN